MKRNRIKKDLEIALTKNFLENKQYYTIESQIKAIKEKTYTNQINKRLTKIGICFNQILPIINNKELKFFLTIKIFKDSINLNRQVNKSLNKKNNNTSIIKIENFFFKAVNAFTKYNFEYNNIFYFVWLLLKEETESQVTF